MDFGLGLLTFGTLGFAVAFGYLSVRATEKLKTEPGHRKSALSRDGREQRLRALRS